MPQHKRPRLVMLCGAAQSSRIMYHGLAADFLFECVIVENKPSILRLMVRRLKRLGLFKVGGQALFMLLAKVLLRISQPRIRELIRRYELQDKAFPDDVLRKVSSVNSAETIGILQSLQPDAVVINGTRLISKDVLGCVKAPFINTHMGITPKYRGVHGGYWALARNDVENCGVTVHLVDQGIDTGGVLYQGRVHLEPCDNITTYPLHQIAAAIPLMRAALRDVEQRQLRVTQGVMPSQLWYHPTLIEYFQVYQRMGVK